MVITPTPVSGMPNTPFTPENSMDVNPNSGALKPPGSDVPVPSSSVITPVIPSTLANLPAIPAWGQAPLSQGTATVTPPAQPAGLFGISTAISAATGIVNSEQNPATSASPSLGGIPLSFISTAISAATGITNSYPSVTPGTPSAHRSPDTSATPVTDTPAAPSEANIGSARRPAGNRPPAASWQSSVWPFTQLFSKPLWQGVFGWGSTPPTITVQSGQWGLAPSRQGTPSPFYYTNNAMQRLDAYQGRPTPPRG